MNVSCSIRDLIAHNIIWSEADYQFLILGSRRLLYHYDCCARQETFLYDHFHVGSATLTLWGKWVHMPRKYQSLDNQFGCHSCTTVSHYAHIDKTFDSILVLCWAIVCDTRICASCFLDTHVRAHVTKLYLLASNSGWCQWQNLGKRK